MKFRSVIFIALISLIGLSTVFFFPTEEIKEVYAGYGGGVRGLVLMAMDHSTLAKQLNDHVVLHDRWIDLFGGMQRAAGVDMIEDQENSIYRLRDGRVTFIYSDNVPFSEAETEGVQTLKQTADAVSARSIFAVIPRKTCSRDSAFMSRGVQSYSENIDNYRKGVFADAGFETLDLHEKMHEQGKDHASLYFRTDHHWTAHTGLWAAKEIGDALGLDTTLLEPSRYTVEKHAGIFLGSEGKHGGRLYCAPDDLDILIPNFDTALTLTIDDDAPRSGSFREALLFPDRLTLKPYKAFFPYSVYLNGDYGCTRIQNTRQPDGMRILMVKDSYTNSLAPYLSLCCAQVDMIDLRNFKGSVSAYIDEMRPDAVCAMMSSTTSNKCFAIR